MIKKWSKIGPQSVQKWSKIGRKIVQNWSKNGPKMVQNWSKIGPKFVQKWSKHGPKMVQKWSKIGTKLVQIVTQIFKADNFDATCSVTWNKNPDKNPLCRVIFLDVRHVLIKLYDEYKTKCIVFFVKLSFVANVVSLKRADLFFVSHSLKSKGEGKLHLDFSFIYVV